LGGGGSAAFIALAKAIDNGLRNSTAVEFKNLASTLKVADHNLGATIKNAILSNNQRDHTELTDLIR